MSFVKGDTSNNENQLLQSRWIVLCDQFEKVGLAAAVLGESESERPFSVSVRSVSTRRGGGLLLLRYYLRCAAGFWALL